MRHRSCNELILFVYRLNMRTYSSLGGGGYVVVLYAIEDVMQIEDVMLPIHVFFGGGGEFHFC